jgi:predicted DNA binding protein
MPRRIIESSTIQIQESDEATFPGYYFRLLLREDNSPFCRVAKSYPDCKIWAMPYLYGSSSEVYHAAFMLKCSSKESFSAVKRLLDNDSQTTELRTVHESAAHQLIAQFVGKADSLTPKLIFLRLAAPIFIDSNGAEFRVMTHDKSLVKEIQESLDGRLEILEFDRMDVSYSDWLFPARTWLGLNEYELNFLRICLREGLYSIPRKTTYEALGRKLGIPHSRLQRHLARIEHKIISQIVNGGNGHADLRDESY